MSTASPDVPHRPQPGEPLTGQNEIRIVSHSNLFYWWPVWAVGYIMAAITLVDGHFMSIVPKGSERVVLPAGVQADGNDIGGHEALVAPKVYVRDKPTMTGARLRMARNKNLGVIYLILVLVVIFITNMSLRGLWSVIVIMVLIFGSIILALTDMWAPIMEAFEVLNIHINLAGYVVLSTVLFVVWLITLLLFDQQIYMIFTPGQLRVRLEIGEGETAYDTRGMTVQKQRSDLFKHWILGLGSGDLLVNTSGAQVHHFDLPNVLFVGRKVKEIENMLRSMPVVQSPG
jgi:hypothetical protein